MMHPASASAEVISLDYSAPTTCPSAAEFEAEIRGLVPGLQVVSVPAPARTFQVMIDEGGRSGQLRLLTEQGDGSRFARGADCAEVVRLLAFSVALVLDPQLKMPAPAETEVSDATRRLGEEPGILPRPLPVLVAPSASALPTPPLARSAGGGAQPSSQGLAVVGLVASALSPTVSYGLGARYDLGATWRGLEPQLRLGASYFRSADASRDGATVSFAAALATVEGCPIRWSVGRVSLWPCLRLDAGARTTAGHDIPGAKARVRPWLSLAAMLQTRVRWPSPFFLEIGGGTMVPAWNDHVYLEPNITVHRVPRLGWLGEIAVGVEFTDRNRN